MDDWDARLLPGGIGDFAHGVDSAATPSHRSRTAHMTRTGGKGKLNRQKQFHRQMHR
jgi:hypothetical protein